MTATDETTLRIERLDGELLVVEGLGLARGFFAGDRSSVGPQSYDALAGRGAADRIEADDVSALNRTMRARTPHAAWEALLDRPLAWLAQIDPGLDLIAMDDERWEAGGGRKLASAALQGVLGPGRGIPVATKMLHYKRPAFFPVLDDFVAVMLGRNRLTEIRPDARAVAGAQLVERLREQGRHNLSQLQRIQEILAADDGVERSLTRILDAIVWFSHPAAGVTGVRRKLTATTIAGGQ